MCTFESMPVLMESGPSPSSVCVCVTTCVCVYVCVPHAESDQCTALHMEEGLRTILGVVAEARGWTLEHVSCTHAHTHIHTHIHTQTRTQARLDTHTQARHNTQTTCHAKGSAAALPLPASLEVSQCLLCSADGLNNRVVSVLYL